MKPELLYSIADVINANGDTYRAVVPYAKHDYMVQEGSVSCAPPAMCSVSCLPASPRTMSDGQYGTSMRATWIRLSRRSAAATKLLPSA